MDKVLAFSILSASPADIAAAATSGSRWTKLSWRQGSAGDHHAEDPSASKANLEEEPQQRRSSRSHRDGGGRDRAARGASSVPRFALEFDGIDCFETIVSH